MRNRSSLLSLTIILILLFSLGAAAGPQGKISDMNFKNADLVDVLRAIAEVADVNLVSDSSVTGTITVHLQNITFQKSLDLITETKKLDYKWDGNTIVVATPERIDDIYSKTNIKLIKVESSDIENMAVILRELYPETKIQVDAVRGQFILQGKSENIAEVEEMIGNLEETSLEIAEKEKEEAEALAEQIKEEKQTETEEEIEFVTKSYMIKNAELEDLTSKLSAVNPELTVKSNPLTETITITGEEQMVKEALSMAETYDNSLEPETRVIRVDYVDIEQITPIMEKLYPNVKLHVNEKRKEIIVNGPKNKLDNAVNIVKSLNTPKQQVVIEARVEEVSSGFVRELGIENLSDFSKIEFVKNLDDQIKELDYTWPQFFKALDENTDSTTLANPRLMTLNGEKAVMTILDEEPYITDIEETDAGGLEYSWDYVTAGVTLEFTPWITENNEIELQIAPEVSSFQLFDSDQLKPPSKQSRKVETRLRLRDGETIVIGGLIQTDDEGVITKIPLLGDIPLIGEMFKSRRKDEKVNELVIFVTPKIINYEDEIEKEEHLIKTYMDDNTDKISVDGEKSTDKSEEKTDTNSKVVEEKIESKEPVQKQENNGTEEKPAKEFQDLTPEELEEILKKDEKSAIKNKAEIITKTEIMAEIIKDSDSGKFKAPAGRRFYYRVHKGQSIKDIAEIYNVSADNIYVPADLNPGDVVEVIVPDERIYHIKKGDTIWSLAKEKGLEPEIIMDINQIFDVTNISVGQELIFPVAENL